MKSYRELRVWSAGIRLVKDVYRASSQFPGDERFGLTSQIRRAAVSVPSNIAEGHEREGTREFLHHLSIALASLAEVETQLEIAHELEFLDEETHRSLLADCGELGKQMNRLRAALRSRSDFVAEDGAYYGPRS